MQQVCGVWGRLKGWGSGVLGALRSAISPETSSEVTAPTLWGQGCTGKGQSEKVAISVTCEWYPPPWGGGHTPRTQRPWRPSPRPRLWNVDHGLGAGGRELGAGGHGLGSGGHGLGAGGWGQWAGGLRLGGPASCPRKQSS